MYTVPLSLNSLIFSVFRLVLEKFYPLLLLSSQLCYESRTAIPVNKKTCEIAYQRYWKHLGKKRKKDYDGKNEVYKHTIAEKKKDNSILFF